MTKVKPVIFVDSNEELEYIASSCDFDKCAYCCYCDLCIDGTHMWAYGGFIANTPEELYARLN